MLRGGLALDAAAAEGDLLLADRRHRDHMLSIAAVGDNSKASVSGTGDFSRWCCGPVASRAQGEILLNLLQRAAASTQKTLTLESVRG